jgi:glycosyltransferase involved in cell wall biosynthesis
LEQAHADNTSSLIRFPKERARWVLDPSLRSRLKRAILESSGVHIHGLWETHAMSSSSVLRGVKRPYIVSAHGMLDPWALRHKRIRKAVYAALIEIRGMRGAACLRALTEDEVGDYRRLGLTNPIAIVPNGIDPPLETTPGLFWHENPALMGKRIILFLGRLHHKKGLDILLQAWARIVRKSDDVHLVIAGPDSDNTLLALLQLAADLKLGNHVTFAGMLSGQRKWSTIAAADLFVLPSYSEGFSMAILEALSIGVPVLVSAACHFPEIESYECGWVIQPALDPLESALDDFLHTSPEVMIQMGQRGRELTRERFHWSVVGQQMAEVYDWLQGGPKPSRVQIA